MAKSYQKSKGRRGNRSYVGFPRAVIEHRNFVNLSANGLKLLIDMYQQFRGFNNGDLSVAWEILKPRGWISRDTLAAALAELIHYEFIAMTRCGGRNKPSLYAVTWYKIDECLDSNKTHKLDLSPTNAPSDLWKTEKPKWVRQKWVASRMKDPSKAPKNPKMRKKLYHDNRDRVSRLS